MIPLRQRLLGWLDWEPVPEQIAQRDAASAVMPAHLYWHQRKFTERNPVPV